MFKKTRDFFKIALLISLFLHFGTFISLLLQKPKVQEKNVEVDLIDDETMKKRMAEMKKLNQIVEQNEKPLNDEIDEKAKYLSRFNQKVVEETKAEKVAKFENAAKQGMAPKTTTQQQVAQQEKTQTSEKKVADKIKTNLRNGDIGLPKLTDLKPRFDWNKASIGVQNPGPQSATNDYLKDTKTGPQTLLSAREFIFYSYYARIKERIGMFWEPKIKEKVKRVLMSGRKIASDQERVTKLLIILDGKGNLVKIQVLGEAGIRDLDDAAVEAFQAAAPFPNPPKGITEEDGTIKIQWDFILLEANAGPLAPTLAQSRP